MTVYGADLHKDQNDIVTSQRYGAVGDGSNQWYNTVKVLEGDDVSQGAKADAAVTNPADPGSVIGLLKGLISILTARLTVGATTILKAEDDVAASGDAGVQMLAVRRDTPVSDVGAAGDYHPLHVDSLGALRVTESTPVAFPANATSVAYATNLVVKASAGRLFGVQGYNSNASPQFIQVHNATSLPVDTSVPVITFLVPGTSPFSIDFGRLGRYFATGIVLCNSSSGPTKTIGAADCWFDAQYQ